MWYIFKQSGYVLNITLYYFIVQELFSEKISLTSEVLVPLAMLLIKKLLALIDYKTVYTAHITQCPIKSSVKSVYIHSGMCPSPLIVLWAGDFYELEVGDFNSILTWMHPVMLRKQFYCLWWMHRCHSGMQCQFSTVQTATETGAKYGYTILTPFYLQPQCDPC